jgi:hypothetical protein
LFFLIVEIGSQALPGVILKYSLFGDFIKSSKVQEAISEGLFQSMDSNPDSFGRRLQEVKKLELFNIVLTTIL